MTYKDRVDIQQLNELVDKYNRLYEKQEILKVEKQELNKYCKNLGYHPGILSKVVKINNHNNLDKIKKEEELFSLYKNALD